MAVLIPANLRQNREVLPNDARIGEALAAALPAEAWVWYNPPSHSDRPRFIAISPEHGIVAVDVKDWSPMDVSSASASGVVLVGGEVEDPAGELGYRIESIRNTIGPVQPQPAISGFVVLPNFRPKVSTSDKLKGYFPPDVLVKGDLDFLAPLSRRANPRIKIDLEALRGRLYPETEFVKKRLVSDNEGATRIAVRHQLDLEQESIARGLGSGVTLLYGVAGSGKTLVLCARARVLAQMHPEWTIQILCFNRTLVEYIRSLVGLDTKDIRVNTFFGWAKDLGIRLPSMFGEDSQERIDQAVERALEKGLGKGTCDALLIDEGQDFGASWIALAAQTVRPNSGGVLVASDVAQSIYRESSAKDVFESTELEEIFLGRNYRNTAEIGSVAHAVVFDDPGAEKRNWEASARRPIKAQYALQGAPVQIVWAPTWDSQAEFVAKEIRRLLDDGQAAPRDIAVLYTQRQGTIARLLKEFELGEIPHYWANRDQSAKIELDLSENSVKLMTVHSSKGLEFPFVFLFGVEALKVPSDLKDASEEAANKKRLAYVGMTRAQDLLYLTYTRSNAVLDRGLALTDWVEFWSYPEDYEFED